MLSQLIYTPVIKDATKVTSFLEFLSLLRSNNYFAFTKRGQSFSKVCFFYL